MCLANIYIYIYIYIYCPEQNLMVEYGFTCIQFPLMPVDKGKRQRVRPVGQFSAVAQSSDFEISADELGGLFAILIAVSGRC